MLVAPSASLREALRPGRALKNGQPIRRLPIGVNIGWRPRLKGHTIFGSVWRPRGIGRVSPRPQDRGRNCTLLGREPLREAKAFGQIGRWVAGDRAVRRLPDAPYLRGRQTATLS